jgi:hypothetical protein
VGSQLELPTTIFGPTIIVQLELMNTVRNRALVVATDFALVPDCSAGNLEVNRQSLLDVAATANVPKHSIPRVGLLYHDAFLTMLVHGGKVLLRKAEPNFGTQPREITLSRDAPELHETSIKRPKRMQTASNGIRYLNGGFETVIKYR